MREKTCNKCGEVKDIKAFKICGKGSNGREYRENVCRLCKSKLEPKRVAYKYICVRDPTELYPIGVKLTVGNMNYTLEQGYMSPRSIWRDSLDVIEYIVVGNEHWHDINECVKKPDESYLKSVREKQRMVRI